LAAFIPASNTSKSRWGRWLLILLVAVVALFALYTAAVLNWSYSRGERAGYVQKFSQKGWVCKTWEGELAMVSMPGTLAEKFLFSVRDDKVADKINKSMGKRVSLVYEEHLGIPTSCFGDTAYFVTDVRQVE
jgi:ABC-type phosphate/phosphonate transport system permease subunit